MSTPPQGLICILSHCEPDVPTQDFNEWYDIEHGPARMLVPGVITGIRYKALDGEEPQWLALYELESLQVTQSSEFLNLRNKASEEERILMARLPILQRREYSLIKQSVGSPSALPGKYLLLIIWEVQEELETDFKKWYDEEHMADVSKVPGWLKGSVYKFVDGADRASKKGPPLGNYLAVHHWDRGDYRSTQEFKTAVETEWSKRILTSVKAFNPRGYELHKAF